jgi:PKD repeat protein
VSGVGVVSFKATVPVPPNQSPAAAFTANCPQLACSFNADGSRDPDGRIASWAWDFGDGSKSDAKNPSHTYAAAGTYNVTLTVTDNGGATNAVTHPTTVSAPPPPAQNQAPTAAFTPSCTDLSCGFTDQSGDPDGRIVSWSWQFGDGARSGERSPSHAYAAPGTYNVTLTVTDNGGATNAVTHAVTVAAPPPPPQNQAPTAAFTFTCADLTCTFADHSTDSDGSIASRIWDFGDGTTSTAQNPSHPYGAGGTYNVKLTVTDNGGATNTVIHPVTVTAPTPPNQSPTAAFTFTCADLTCTFADRSTDTDGSIASRIWDFGDGTTSTGQNPAHPYAAGGPYNVTLTVTDNGGLSNAVVHQVTVNRAPTASDDQAATAEDISVTIAVLGNDVDPDGDALTASILANPTNGIAAVDPGGTITYTPNPNFSGTDSFTYTATDPSGASSTATVTITVSPVNDAPSFQIGAKKVSADPGDGPQTIGSLATDISAGPGETQTVAFTTTADRPDLFTIEPAIDPTGTLTFTPATGATGDTVVTVTLRDDAGGVSDPQTFSLEIKGQGND